MVLFPVSMAPTNNQQKIKCSGSREKIFHSCVKYEIEINNCTLKKKKYTKDKIYNMQY